MSGSPILILLLLVWFLVHRWWASLRYRMPPGELYRQIFETASNYVADPTSLPEWKRWEENAPSEEASTAEVIDKANDMLGHLQDPYTYVFRAGRSKPLRHSDEFIGIGVRIAALYEDPSAAHCRESGAGDGCLYPTIVGVFNNSPAKEAGLMPGDLIVSIDGQSTRTLPLASVKLALRGKHGRVALGIKSNGVERTVVLHRRTIINPGSSARMMGKIGYLHIADFSYGSANMVSYLSDNLRRASVVLIDLRENPGGQVSEAFAVAAMFMSDGLLAIGDHRYASSLDRERSEVYAVEDGVHTRWSVGEKTFERTEWIQSAPLRGKRVALLVNENTASAAELLTAALHDTYGATIYGARTFGKGVSQLTIPLPNNIQLKVTTGKYYRPNGLWAGNGADNRIGIEQDVFVSSPVESFNLGGGDDEQLNETLKLLNASLDSH